jgi:hypothetical protein
MQQQAVRIFLRELIEDAHAFSLGASDFDTSLSVDERLRAGSERWMIGGLVIPASRLAALLVSDKLQDLRNHLDGKPLPTSVIFDSPDPRDDYGAISGYLQREDQPLALRSVTVRIPRVAGVDPHARVHAVVHKLGAAELPHTISVFLEMPHDAQPLVGDLVKAVAQERSAGRIQLCAKVRCGGASAEAVPDPLDLAFFIVTAHGHDVPFKAVGGLVQPLHGMNAKLGYVCHGFLNVMGAAVLSSALHLDAQTITQMLTDEDPQNFRLDNERFAWKEHSVDAMAIFNARLTLIRSFESEDPQGAIDGLFSMGILQTPATTHARLEATAAESEQATPVTPEGSYT